jgi:hypothetical protein
MARQRDETEVMPRIGKFGHLDILGRLFEALKIGSARSDLYPVIGLSVKDTDWVIAHAGIVNVSRDAGRI